MADPFRPMIDEEPSPDKHAHKAAEPSSSKATAGAAGTKGSGPLSIPVPKTDLSAGALAVCNEPVSLMLAHHLKCCLG